MNRYIRSTALLALLLVPLASAQDTPDLRLLARDAGINLQRHGAEN